MLLGVQPSSIGQTSATTPAQTKITFELVGRIFLGSAEDVIEFIKIQLDGSFGIRRFLTRSS